MNAKEAIEFLEKLKHCDKTFSDRGCKERLCKIQKFLQRGEKIEEDLIQFLEKENPYPENVFLPIEKEDFNKINDLLKKEMGYSIDRLFGNMGRKLYKSIIEILREMIK